MNSFNYFNEHLGVAVPARRAHQVMLLLRRIGAVLKQHLDGKAYCDDTFKVL